MRRHIEGHSSKVDLPVGVDARDDEEDTGTLGASLEETTEAEDDRSLVLLHHLQKGPRMRTLQTGVRGDSDKTPYDSQGHADEEAPEVSGGVTKRSLSLSGQLYNKHESPFCPCVTCQSVSHTVHCLQLYLLCRIASHTYQWSVKKNKKQLSVMYQPATHTHTHTPVSKYSIQTTTPLTDLSNKHKHPYQ